MLVLLLVFSYKLLVAANWKVSFGLYIVLALDLLLILMFNITRPFVFSSKDANNLILYGAYLATAGALFSILTNVFKKEIFSGEMPSAVKSILIWYLLYSALLLILISIEAYGLR